jgi:hypothetical protein
MRGDPIARAVKQSTAEATVCARDGLKSSKIRREKLAGPA